MHFVIITWQGPSKHPWFWNLLNLHFLASISWSHRSVWTKVTNGYLIKLKNWPRLTWSVVKCISRIAAISAAKLTQLHQCTAIHFKSLARETDTQESLGITELFSVAFWVRLMLHHLAASVPNPVTGIWLEHMKVSHLDLKISRDGEFTLSLGKLSPCLHFQFKLNLNSASC